jgi:cytochrome c oxidase subunit 2
MEINVVGKQWMWKIQHGDGQREINELHVPIGKPVKLIMTSQDVIHDFFIPAFRVKMDVIPGRYTTEWFEATKAGEYHLFCSQFCGTLHAAMIGKIVAMEPDKYQAWLAGSVIDETPTAAGAKLFAQFSCISCHSQRAPTMAGLFGSDVKVYEDGVLKTVKADEGYIRESIVDPDKKIVQGYQPLMPSFEGQLTEEQIYELIAYIKSLGPTGGPADDYKMINRYPAPAPELTPR